MLSDRQLAAARPRPPAPRARLPQDARGLRLTWRRAGGFRLPACRSRRVGHAARSRFPICPRIQHMPPPRALPRAPRLAFPSASPSNPGDHDAGVRMTIPRATAIGHAHTGTDHIALDYEGRLLRRKRLVSAGGPGVPRRPPRNRLALRRRRLPPRRRDRGRRPRRARAADRGQGRPRAPRLAHRQPPHALPDRRRPPPHPPRPRARRHAPPARRDARRDHRPLRPRRRGLRARADLRPRPRAFSRPCT